MHTPGPWTQATHSPTDVVANDRMMIAMARDGLNGITRNQAVANARLIAAAPDMLEALQELVQYVRDEFACSHPLCEAADRASAAIAAATKD